MDLATRTPRPEMLPRLPTPPLSPARPQLILCADGGGSKVCVVVRSEDGLERRGYAGPSNVQSVGYQAASQNILLAAYRALSLLPSTHIPPSLEIPPVQDISCPSSGYVSPVPQAIAPAPVVPVSAPAPSAALPISLQANGKGLPTPPSSVSSALGEPNLAAAMNNTLAPPLPPPSFRPNGNGASTPRLLPPLNVPLFRSAWLGLAGISSKNDEDTFGRYIAGSLAMDAGRVKISNVDVNLLAAPALNFPGISHVLTLVAGTGSVGRTIRLSSPTAGQKQTLPLDDVAVAKGWGYLLCDEGSAYWLGRLSIRLLLSLSDRLSSSSIYSSPPPPLLPLHQDLLDYFGVTDPLELIGLVSLGGEVGSLGMGVGEAVGKRNALIAGAARIVFRYAFPHDEQVVKDRQDKDRTRKAAALAADRGMRGWEGEGDVDWSESERGSISSSSSMLSLSPDPESADSEETIHQSHLLALQLSRQSSLPLIQLALSLIGDQSIVRPSSSCLALGGGLMMSEGYRGMLLEGLEKEGVRVGKVVVVSDAAVEGARGLAKVQWG
ncbi:hypothetical protein L198_06212 [Cryptococcus wingfieldii CBS 7118]|uniref:N-acetyl-D-glucosamine kinase n=1 Tax=Cryptococcus wingfieldii CBS 7118 TaxID=1295528 RepID=A0A1E3INL6_9TREE|nr:hypothetical protein L198_06212 [Cryptococcus wingfieldii CBS 7118]ODN90194.1 hypothetical protein L198_06212 [Cryptococcus wingfieldii CBS 7118]